MIESEGSIQIARSVAQVFAFVNDFTRAPSWLEACVELKQVSPEERREGSKLHYVYRHGPNEGEMDGVVTAYEKERRLEMSFEDPTFGAEIAFRFTADSGGTAVTHRVGIRPKRLVAKMMAPMIRAGNRRQVASNLDRLKREVERGEG